MSSLTRSTALSPAFEGGDGKRHSGSTPSKPRHLCRGVDGLTYCLDLTAHLAWRDFVLRYEGSVLGILWSLPSPAGDLEPDGLVFGKERQKDIEEAHRKEICSTSLARPGWPKLL
jgi:hypothetical protein